MPRCRKQNAVGFILLITALLLLPGVAWAQARGTLTGTVQDPGGAVVAKAKVTLTNEATQGKWEVESTEAGQFTVRELPPGAYDMAVSYSGFKEYVQKGITIKIGDTATLNVTLTLGATAETVEVHADVQQTKVDSSDIGTSVQNQFAMELPLQVGGQTRSPMQFISLDPAFSGYTPNNPSNQDSFKLAGGQEGGSQVLVDGAAVNLVSPNVQVNYGVGPDAIQEMKVMTGSYPAEYGRTSGGVVSLVTKSGTNAFHGTAYEFLRNKALNANGWWTNEQGLEKGVDNQNNFGFLVSGPVVLPKLYDGRNKTFFMFNYEGYRFSSHGQGLSSAPLDAWYNGDFSSLLNSYTSPRTGNTLNARTLYDYTTCDSTGAACQAFAGNKIPESRMDPVFKNARQYLAHATDQTANLDNLTVNTHDYTNANTYTGKLDQYIGAKHKLAFMLSLDDRPRGETNSISPLWNSSWGAQTASYVRLSEDYTISPTLLNHFNFGFSRRFRIEAQGMEGAGLAHEIGLTGVKDYNFPAFEMRDSHWPGATVGPANGDSQFIDNSYQVNESVSWQHGSHSLKFGFEAVRQQFNTRRFAYSSGDFMFNDQLTGNGTANTGFAFASFYQGLFYSNSGATSQILQGSAIGLRPRYYAGYVQDDYKVNHKLTLNLGLRYDLSMPTTEVHDRMSWMDPTLPNSAAGGLPGAYVFAGDGQGRSGESTPQSAWKKAFGPRVGMAYSVDPKTVVRAGYGIYYSAVKVGGFADADSYGFTSAYTYADSGNILVPAGKLSNITTYPGKPTALDPAIQNGQTASMILSDTARPGTIQNWTIDIQRQLSKDLMVDVAYVGNHADHMQAWMHNPNQLDPRYMSKGACLSVNLADQATDKACAGQAIVASPYPGFSGTVAQALRPFPQYTGVALDNSSDGNPFGFSTYHSLQAKMEKRFSNGLTFLATFAWSKTLTNADSEYPGQAGWNNGNLAGYSQNQYNTSVEKSLSVQDVPKRLVLAYSYDLPVGKGKRFLNQGGVLNVIAGGWNISGVQSYSSGLPLSVLTDGSYTTGTFNSSARANVVGGVDPNGKSLGGDFDFKNDRVINPAAFAQPANYTFGNAARTYNIRKWPTLNEDFTLSKKFRFTETINATFRMDAFNAFNRHVLTGWDMTVTSATFGKATSGAGNRSCQASLRVSF